MVYTQDEQIFSEPHIVVFTALSTQHLSYLPGIAHLLPHSNMALYKLSLLLATVVGLGSGHETLLMTISALCFSELEWRGGFSQVMEHGRQESVTSGSTGQYLKENYFEEMRVFPCRKNYGTRNRDSMWVMPDPKEAPTPQGPKGSENIRK